MTLIQPTLNRPEEGTLPNSEVFQKALKRTEE